MAEEKNSKEKKEDKTELKEKQPRKKSHPNRLISIVKKHAFNLGIGFGAFLLSFVIFMLFFRGGDERRDIMEPGQDVNTEAVWQRYDEISGKSAAVDSGASSGDSIQDVFTAEDLKQFDIDTQKIIQELDFLFITPESELRDLGVTAQDSIDTLNWLDKEMARLKKEKGDIERQRKQLEGLEKRIDQAMIQINEAESARIVNLARLYDGMKAQDVAKLFANLSDEVIISILPRMKPANASKILGLLPPKRAAKISTQMITVLEDR